MGVWIETYYILDTDNNKVCHTLRGCVDWNFKDDVKLEKLLSHTLRGCVDWNYYRG